MFIATALLYPCVLAALCLGSGLLVDRVVGRFLAASLLLPVGAAGLLAASQLCTYAYPLAPATPYLMGAMAIAGFALGRDRAIALARIARRRPWLPGVSVLAYLIALAPVLAAGRTTFSSYMTLADSAVHLIGADFLIRHGQHYAQLDLRNSYGRFISGYYDNSSYPSGADTLFGGSAFLLGLPLIWAFQPFNAFMLAIGTGPAFSIARRMGLQGAWAALAALTAVLPALVYAYELFGSIKEIVALPLIIALGALIAGHRDWLALRPARPTRVLPAALLLAGGVSALGIAFGAWGLVCVGVPAVLLASGLRAGGGRELRGALMLGVCAGAVLLIAAWPIWHELAGSVKLAQEIATTGKAGNLSKPLRAIQVAGVWLGGSYKLAPRGSALDATHALIALTLLAALLGAWQLLRRRLYALGGWVALMLLAWLVVSLSTSTWASAKTLMLTSPVVVLLAWGGVAALRELPAPRFSRAIAVLVAVGLLGGVLVSDALQYHVGNLAPTARYQELALLDSHFAGQGPTLFTDFDEYSMYELRDLDVGGPSFVYPPPAIANAAGGYGDPVQLDRISPSVLAAYPLIVTRREPAEIRPPGAYELVWQGVYYQVWRRHEGEQRTVIHRALTGTAPQQCRAIGQLAAVKRSYFGPQGAFGPNQLTASIRPLVVSIPVARAAHPKHWGHERQGLVMSSPGRLSATFTLPHGGLWNLWVQGQLMPTVKLDVDGRAVASIGAQLSGNSLVPTTAPPIAMRLGTGPHSLWVTRGGASTLAPGDGGAAVLDAIALTPGSLPAGGALRSSSLADWRRLCGTSYQWVELDSVR
ncbi:MAG TPA: hypothetical protein VGN25_10815 [Solirubrobacteraceae bacterium]|jgi:hypothetical protein|nr:hypothetical protein [Solirubrobacteraceae bacterium]